MTLEALLFDVDGTLADTEEVHRQAFEAAFREHGLDWSWPPPRYRELLEVTGGKERISHFVGTLGLPAAEANRLRALVPDLHAAKTRHFARGVAEGAARARTGIVRLVQEARCAARRLGIASTTSPENVEALLPKVLGAEARSWFAVVSTGDVVPRKKPAPDVYLHALAGLGLAPERCVAFEDSEPGVRAAREAGLFTVAVPNAWTAAHDLSGADVVLPSLGDPDAPLAPEVAARIGGPWLGLSELVRLHQSWLEAGGRIRNTRIAC